MQRKRLIHCNQHAQFALPPDPHASQQEYERHRTLQDKPQSSRRTHLLPCTQSIHRQGTNEADEMHGDLSQGCSIIGSIHASADDVISVGRMVFHHDHQHIGHGTAFHGLTEAPSSIQALTYAEGCTKRITTACFQQGPTRLRYEPHLVHSQKRAAGKTPRCLLHNNAVHVNTQTMEASPKQI